MAPTSTVWKTLFSPCGAYLVSADADGHLFFFRRRLAVQQMPGAWAAQEHDWIPAAQVMHAHTRPIFALAWAIHTPSLLASSGADGAVRIWTVVSLFQSFSQWLFLFCTDKR